MWNLNYDTSELIYETDSQTHRTDLWLPGKGDGEGRIGSLRLADAITKPLLPDAIIQRMDEQQGLTIQHRKQYSIFCDKS